MTNQKYFLPRDYIENSGAMNSDENTDSHYWNKKRLSKSADFQAHVYRRLANLIAETNAKSMIDVGCGPATKLRTIANQFKSLEIHGMDLKPAIDWCNENRDFGHWIAHDIQLPTRPDTIPQADLVVCADVLEHLDGPEKTVELLRSLLKPGGLAIISTPDRDRVMGTGATTPSSSAHVREWNFNEFSQFLTAHGANIVTHYHIWPSRIGPNRAFLGELLTHVRRHLWNLKSTQVAIVKFDSQSPARSASGTPTRNS